MIIGMHMESDLVEIMRPHPIERGFTIFINLYVNEQECGNVTVFDELLKESQQNGTLSEAFRKAWQLEKAPRIRNITVWRIEATESCVHRTWTQRMSASAASAVSLSTWSPYDGKSSV